MGLDISLSYVLQPVRSLRIWDWRQGGCIHLRNLFFSVASSWQKGASEISFSFVLLANCPALVADLARMAGLTKSLCICACPETFRKGSAGDQEILEKLDEKTHISDVCFTSWAGKSQFTESEVSRASRFRSSGHCTTFRNCNGWAARSDPKPSEPYQREPCHLRRPNHRLWRVPLSLHVFLLPPWQNSQTGCHLSVDGTWRYVAS
jgi:hypothetical protein